MVIFPICQLIGYKMIQTPKDNIWRKWLEFLNFYRILSICALLAFAIVFVNTIPLYVAYGIFVIYGVLFAIKHNFAFPVVGRINFVLG